jgi:Cu-Zn family superoxide dismutase
MRTLGSLSIALSFVLLGCGGAQKEAGSAAAAAAKLPGAVATLEPKSGSAVTGTAEFTDLGDGNVQIVVRVAGAQPGKHGLHIHENGDCTAADATSAGGHFNPEKADHGTPEAAPHHSGDFGNIEIGPDGTGTLTWQTKDVTVADGPHSVVGRAVIFHEKEDDLKTQPTGAAGARYACGVVQAAAASAPAK